MPSGAVSRIKRTVFCCADVSRVSGKGTVDGRHTGQVALRTVAVRSLHNLLRLYCCHHHATSAGSSAPLLHCLQHTQPATPLTSRHNYLRAVSLCGRSSPSSSASQPLSLQWSPWYEQWQRQHLYQDPGSRTMSGRPRPPTDASYVSLPDDDIGGGGVQLSLTDSAPDSGAATAAAAVRTSAAAAASTDNAFTFQGAPSLSLFLFLLFNFGFRKRVGHGAESAVVRAEMDAEDDEFILFGALGLSLWLLALLFDFLRSYDHDHVRLRIFRYCGTAVGYIIGALIAAAGFRSPHVHSIIQAAASRSGAIEGGGNTNSTAAHITALGWASSTMATLFQPFCCLGAAVVCSAAVSYSALLVQRFLSSVEHPLPMSPYTDLTNAVLQAIQNRDLLRSSRSEEQDDGVDTLRRRGQRDRSLPQVAVRIRLHGRSDQSSKVISVMELNPSADLTTITTEVATALRAPAVDLKLSPTSSASAHFCEFILGDALHVRLLCMVGAVGVLGTDFLDHFELRWRVGRHPKLFFLPRPSWYIPPISRFQIVGELMAGDLVSAWYHMRGIHRATRESEAIVQQYRSGPKSSR